MLHPDKPNFPDVRSRPHTVRMGRWGGLLCALLLAAALGTGAYFSVRRNRSQTASALLALNYDAAAQGLAPDGTRFRIADVWSEEVLARALESAGLEGTLTPQALAANLTATPSSVEGMQLPAGRTGYQIAASYTITYRKNPELGASYSAQEMLRCILAAYEEVFCERYTSPTFGLAPDWAACDGLDAPARSRFYAKECAKLRRFLTACAEEYPAFRASSGESFASLLAQLDLFTALDLLAEEPDSTLEPKLTALAAQARALSEEAFRERYANALTITFLQGG